MVVVDKVDKGEKKMKKTYDELKNELLQKVLDKHDDLILWATDIDCSQKREYELHIGDIKVRVNNQTK